MKLFDQLLVDFFAFPSYQLSFEEIVNDQLFLVEFYIIQILLIQV